MTPITQTTSTVTIVGQSRHSTQLINAVNCPLASEYIEYILMFCVSHCFFFRKELTAEARELKGELYCLPCHDKMGVPICGACRRPIEGRVVNAMGKQWHVEVCEQHQAYLRIH